MFSTAIAVVQAAMLAACAQAPAVLLPIDDHGAVIHPSSHFAFPPRVGSFVRANVKYHDPKGAALSADYTFATTAVITVHVYPEPPAEGQPGDPLSRHAQTLIIGARQNSDLQLLSDTPVIVTQNGRAYEGRRFAFEYRGPFGGVTQEMFARHYLFLLGRHFIQYRVIYPASEDAKVAPLIQTFLGDLPWPDE